jgi:hypothetical protein
VLLSIDFQPRPWRLVSETFTTAIDIETIRQFNRLQGVSVEGPRAWFPKNSKVPTSLKPRVKQMACMVEALLTSPTAAFRMHFSISFAALVVQLKVFDIAPYPLKWEI